MGGDGGEQIPNFLHRRLQPHGQTFEHGVKTQCQHGQKTAERILKFVIHDVVTVTRLLYADRAHGVEQLLVRGADVAQIPVVEFVQRHPGNGQFVLPRAASHRQRSVQVRVVGPAVQTTMDRFLDEVDEEETNAEHQFGHGHPDVGHRMFGFEMLKGRSYFGLQMYEGGEQKYATAETQQQRYQQVFVTVHGFYRYEFGEFDR